MSAIPGVEITALTQHLDDRGYLYEGVHAYDVEKFGQWYVVGNWTKGTVRGFHCHTKMWDYFHIVSGAALFVLVYQPEMQLIGDDQVDDIVKVTMPAPIIEKYVLSERRPQLLTVPPNVFHGWKSLEENTRLVSTASEVYNRQEPDEIRIGFDTWGADLWDVQTK